jgi:hypothetical protein
VYHKKSAPKGKHAVPFFQFFNYLVEGFPSVFQNLFAHLKPFPGNLVAKLSFSTLKAHGVN